MLPEQTANSVARALALYLDSNWSPDYTANLVSYIVARDLASGESFQNHKLFYQTLYGFLLPTMQQIDYVEPIMLASCVMDNINRAIEQTTRTMQ